MGARCSAGALALGGIYLFSDTEAAEAYREMHTARLASFGITDIRAKSFAVNEPLSIITRGPLGV